MSQRKIKKLKALQTLQSRVEEKESVDSKGSSVREILRNNWKFLVGVCLGTFILYLNSLNGAFVSDDYAAISQNPQAGNFWNSFSGYLPNLVNYFVYKIFGSDSPFPYHSVNLIIYLLTVVSVFIFVYLLTRNKLLTQISIVLFAVNPIHVEAVSWISGKPYLLSGLFVLTSMIFLIKYLHTFNRKYLWMLMVSIGLCFFSDRVRFFALILIGSAYIIAFDWRGKNKINWLKIILIGFLITIVGFVIIYPTIIYRVSVVNSGVNASGDLFYDPFFQYPTSMAKYLQLMFVPFDLTLYHTVFIFPPWLNWMILGSFLSMVVYFWFKNKLLFFSLAFIFLATAPSMAPIKVSWMVAERYAFLGSLGFCMFLAIVIVNIAKYLKLVATTLLICLMVFYSVRTFSRNIDWQTNHNLWVNTCQVSPNSHNAWNNIGDDYDKLKDYENSIKGFTQSTIVKPNYADAYHNRANIFFKIGRLDLARESYQTAIRYTPSLFQTYLSLTQVDMMDKRFDLAMTDATLATQVQPGNPQAWYVLGVVQAQVGQIEAAKVSIERSLQIAPGFKPAVDALIQLRSKT